MTKLLDLLCKILKIRCSINFDFVIYYRSLLVYILNSKSGTKMEPRTQDLYSDREGERRVKTLGTRVVILNTSNTNPNTINNKDKDNPAHVFNFNCILMKKQRLFDSCNS